MADDPVAAALAPIRERYCRRRLAHMQEDLYASSEDVPRLLAALETVLELTRDKDGNDRHPDRMLRVGDVRSAVSRKLLSEEGSDAL